MTSFRQIEANRRNAQNSTGPKTETGKQRSRGNAVRHGLTAETVIDALEDAEDYKAFEAADYRRTMMRNRQSSGNSCCGWPACYGGCVAPAPWNLACSKSKPISSATTGRPAKLIQNSR